MNIKTVITGPIAVNTYIISNNNDCIVIDPGGDYHSIMNEVGNMKVNAVLLTHGHFDHIGAAVDFQNNGVPIIIHYNDENKLRSQKILALRCGVNLKDIYADKLLNGDEVLSYADMNIQVLHTPGHSSGSVVYIIDRIIFSGDTLFLGSYGRCDLQDGDFSSIRNSIINKIFTLEGDYTIYPGHEDITSLSYERIHNPILL